MAHNFINIKRGSSFKERLINFYDTEGNELSLVGLNIIMQLRRNSDDALVHDFNVSTTHPNANPAQGKAMLTGFLVTFPVGVYRYDISLRDQTGSIVFSDIGTFQVINTISKWE